MEAEQNNNILILTSIYWTTFALFACATSPEPDISFQIPSLELAHGRATFGY